jgi:ankyrin repeat protein
MKAFAGRLEVVNLLIQAGANLNYQDSSFGDMNTAAHKAILNKHVDIFDVLVKHSVDLSIRNKDGLTAVELKAVMDSEEAHQEGLPTENASTDPAMPICSEVGAPMVSLINCSFCKSESFSLSRTKQGKLVCDLCLKRNPTLKWK